jgi:hypothetical protein
MRRRDHRVVSGKPGLRLVAFASWRSIVRLQREKVSGTRLRLVEVRVVVAWPGLHEYTQWQAVLGEACIHTFDAVAARRTRSRLEQADANMLVRSEDVGKRNAIVCESGEKVMTFAISKLFDAPQTRRDADCRCRLGKAGQPYPTN